MRDEIQASGGQFNPSIGGNIHRAREGRGNSVSLIRRQLGDFRAHFIFFDRIATDDDLRRAEFFPEADVYELANPKDPDWRSKQR